MSRLQLFKLRLAPSATLLLLVFGMIRLLWYPGEFFTIFGVGKQFLLLILASLVLGPAPSAMVYKPGKKDIDRRPEFWKPYAADVVTIVHAGDLTPQYCPPASNVQQTH